MNLNIKKKKNEDLANFSYHCIFFDGYTTCLFELLNVHYFSKKSSFHHNGHPYLSLTD